MLAGSLAYSQILSETAPDSNRPRWSGQLFVLPIDSEMPSWSGREFTKLSDRFAWNKNLTDDGLGSVVALSDVNSVIVERYSYDVFGAPTIYDADSSEIPQSAVDNPYMFTARRADDETALYYYRARYYAFDIGRFLQTDPVGYVSGLNLYTYCRNNPINFVDPEGELWGSIVGGAIGGFVGGIYGGITGGVTGAISGFVSGAVTGVLAGSGVVSPNVAAAIGGAAGAITNQFLNNAMAARQGGATWTQSAFKGATSIVSLQGGAKIAIGSIGGYLVGYKGGGYTTGFGIGLITGAADYMVDVGQTAYDTFRSILERQRKQIEEGCKGT